MQGYREVRQASKFGRLFRDAFIGFSIIMLLWLGHAWVNAAQMVDKHPTGAAVGVAIATSMILFWWVAGAVVLGLFMKVTRGPKILVPVDTESIKIKKH